MSAFLDLVCVYSAACRTELSNTGAWL